MVQKEFKLNFKLRPAATAQLKGPHSIGCADLPYIGLGDDGLQPVRCKFNAAKTRAKKPRKSSLRSISTTNAPFSFVSVKIT
jgi:hypothetical protein